MVKIRNIIALKKHLATIIPRFDLEKSLSLSRLYWVDKNGTYFAPKEFKQMVRQLKEQYPMVKFNPNASYQSGNFYFLEYEDQVQAPVMAKQKVEILEEELNEEIQAPDFKAMRTRAWTVEMIKEDAARHGIVLKADIKKNALVEYEEAFNSK